MLCYMSLRGLFERIRYVEGRLRAFLLVHSFWGVLSSAGQSVLVRFPGFGASRVLSYLEDHGT